MISKRVIIVFVLGISLALSTACSQAGGGPAAQTPQGPEVSVQGKVGFMERIGGYYILVESPPSEFVIDNPDAAVLDPLVKSQKMVTVIGRTTTSADHLFVTKIDGKAYRAKAQAL